MNENLPVKSTAPEPPDLLYQAGGPMDALGPAPAHGLHLQKFLVFLLRFWWVSAITLALSLAGAAAFFFLAPPDFVSRATLWETEKLRLPGGAVFDENQQSLFGTQSELLRSDTLGLQALARLRASGTNTVPLGKDGKPLPVKITVSAAPRSSVVVVQATSANPSYTRAYLDALINEYLAYRKNIRQVVSGDTLASISAQVLRLETDLKSNQDALTGFQRTNNLAVLEEEGAIAGSYLTRLKTQLSDYKLESQLLEATALEQEALGTAGTNTIGSLLESVRGQSSGAPSPAATERQTAFKELELLRMQREKLSKYLRPKHPKIVKLDGDIERGQKLIELYRNQNREQLAAARQAVKMKADSVDASIREWEQKVVQANARIAEAERLKLNITRAQSLYDRLLSLLQNVDISRNIDQATLNVLEPASEPERSYRKPIMISALGIFGGICAGIAIVFLIAMLDDRFTSVVDITEQLGDGIVGQVPELPAVRGQPPLLLLEANDDRHMYAESYRNLRSALLFLAVEGQRPRLLLVTSAVPNEGKSTIATNLARALAMGSARVLLVDGDLRRGRLHDVLGCRREPGLVEALHRPQDLEQFVQANALPNLAFLACGRHTRNPSDLFLGSRFDELAGLMRQRYEYVIIDSSPVFAADDATTLAPKVDGTLVVVRSRFSRAGVVREALDLLYQRQAKVLGLVLNRANSRAHSYNYYKYGEYYAGQTKDQGPETVDQTVKTVDHGPQTKDSEKA
jgi:polysaccharide biosynthesis transport protein